MVPYDSCLLVSEHVGELIYTIIIPTYQAHISNIYSYMKMERLHAGITVRSDMLIIDKRSNIKSQDKYSQYIGTYLYTFSKHSTHISSCQIMFLGTSFLYILLDTGFWREWSVGKFKFVHATFFSPRHKLSRASDAPSNRPHTADRKRQLTPPAAHIDAYDPLDFHA